MIQPELNGGKLTREQIDRLAETPSATASSISGLDQKNTGIFLQSILRAIYGDPLSEMPAHQRFIAARKHAAIDPSCLLLEPRCAPALEFSVHTVFARPAF